MNSQCILAIFNVFKTIDYIKKNIKINQKQLDSSKSCIKN